MVTGLLSGMTLSMGGAVGADAWQVPAADLASTWILPPKDFVGAADLVAELRLADDTIANRRPIHLEWVRDIRDQCAEAGVAFFFKQWGGRTPKSGGRMLDGRKWDEMPTILTSTRR